MRHTIKSTNVICFLAVAVLIAGCHPASAQLGPKNIIVMISDGCGYNHVDAASLYQYGKTAKQPYERFPVKLAMATYADGQDYDPDRVWADFNDVADSDGCTDSAAAATAMSTGVKTFKGAIGLGPDKKPLTHTVIRAEKQGKATGVITSVQLSHATPAGHVAHSKSRDNYDKIAREMIYESPLEVIMGCGHPEYDNNGKLIEKGKKDKDGKEIELEYKYVGGQKTWLDLKDGSVTGADADADGEPDDWTVIYEPDDFRKLMKGPTPKRVIGIPKKHKTLQQERSSKRKADPYVVPYNGDVPTLPEMAAAAINVLDDDPDGFFLMIEGGAVDWAGHSNQSGRLIEEQIEFNKTIETVIKWVKANGGWDKTLLIITADHECGYLTGPDSGTFDGKPRWNPLKNNGKGKTPGMEWHSNYHTNSLVPFYANGFGCELFVKQAKDRDPVHGPYLDNTELAKTIAFLLGPGKTDQN
ncbi:MAG: alkaline phosphatase [Sedimentisphaerales bacterium]|nr:alkaline phosphatase [Sedimentisphaerales bacterium]